MGKQTLRLLNRFKQGQPAFATFMALRGMRTAQIVARTGLDAVIIDCEHGNIADSDMHDMVSAVASSGVSPIVRTRGPTLPLIKRALDTGAHGLLVPMINNAADARSVVSSAKFPPTGIRGQGSAFSCFEFGLDHPSEYVAQANESILTMVQIESAQGLKNVEEICQVDGVDLVFIGPNDLALALLGYTPAKGNEKVFLEAIDKIAAAGKKHGKKIGMLVPDGKAAAEAKKRFDLIAIGTDVRALQAWYRNEVALANS